MVTNNSIHTDLYQLYNVVQNNLVLYPKEAIIWQLRDFFSRDSTYHFATDHFGFPQTPNQAGLPPSAGYKDSLTTRLYISAAHRYDVIYYPAIIVKHGGANSVPVSINRETACVQWGNLVFEDGYGNIKLFPTPQNYIFAGAWEGTINIDILARDPRTRDDLVGLVTLLFVDLAFEDMRKAGIIIKPNAITAGSPTESMDRTDVLFKQTISLGYRSEWRRYIPISNIIDTINFSVEFANPITAPPDPNLTIHIEETLTDIINNL